MPPIRPLLLGLAVFAAGCTTTGSQPSIFGGTAVRHPEALFDVSRRSAALRQVSAGTGQRKGERICVRVSDVPAFGPLIGPSLAAVKAGGDSNNDARDMARALNAAAFSVLYRNDEALARASVAVIRQHADANAWLVVNPSWTNAAGVVNTMGALLPAWQILRQTSAATPEDKAAIEGWLRRLAVQMDEHPGDNNIGTARGAADICLLYTSDAADEL